MKNYLILKLLLLLLVFNGIHPVASLAKEGNDNPNFYKLFTNTCDSMNFVTIQLLLKTDSSHNLNNFKYIAGQKVNKKFKDNIISGIDEKPGGNFKEGMLLQFISWYHIKKNDSTLFKLCQKIEKKKQTLRGSKKNCTIKDSSKFSAQLNKLITFITTQVKNTNSKSDSLLKSLLTKYKEQVILKKFSDTKGSVGAKNNSSKKVSKATKKAKNDTKLNGIKKSIKNIEKNVNQNTKRINLLKKSIKGITTPIAELKKNKANNTIVYLVLCLSILSLLFWIIFFISNYRKSKEHRPHDGTIDYLNKTTFPHYDKAIDEINSRIKFVVNELDSMQKSLGLYNAQMETLKQAMEKSAETQEVYMEKPEETSPVPVTTNRYYLPFPDKQGFFWDDKKSETPVSSSIYIMELENTNSTRGTFTLDLKNEKNIRTALTNPTTFLKPVCESIDNNFYGKRIEIINEGVLQLRDDRWSVNGGRKIMIKIS